MCDCKEMLAIKAKDDSEPDGLLNIWERTRLHRGMAWAVDRRGEAAAPHLWRLAAHPAVRQLSGKVSKCDP
jgi:hypothetical protein